MDIASPKFHLERCQRSKTFYVQIKVGSIYFLFERNLKSLCTWSNNLETVSHASWGFFWISSKAEGQRANGLTHTSDCFLLGVLWGLGGKLRGENAGEPKNLKNTSNPSINICYFNHAGNR